MRVQGHKGEDTRVGGLQAHKVCKDTMVQASNGFKGCKGAKGARAQEM